MTMSHSGKVKFIGTKAYPVLPWVVDGEKGFTTKAPKGEILWSDKKVPNPNSGSGSIAQWIVYLLKGEVYFM